MDDILDILVAHGVPGDVIVRVAKLIADSQVTESRRTKNRERMKSVRARAHTSMHTETQPASIKEDTSFLKTKIKKVSKKVPMPADWKLADADHAFAASKSWAPDRIDSEAERFRDYWLANGKPMADWAACWRKWVTSPYQNGKGGQGNGNGRRHGSVLDAFDRLGEKLKAAGASDDYVPGTSGPRPLELDTQVRPNGLKLVPKG